MEMITRRFKHLFEILSTRAFFYRNTHNSRSFWKRSIIFLPWYVLSLVFALFDVFQLGSGVAMLIRLTHKSRRRLNNEELELFSNLPTEQSYLKTIWVYERSSVARFGKWMTRRSTLGLGITNTIHFSREVNTREEADKRWLVHEIAHTLQYKYRGLVYIPESLIAQQFSGYSFGGISTLKSSERFRAFNPEQQADMLVIIQLSDISCPIRQEIEKGKW